MTQIECIPPISWSRPCPLVLRSKAATRLRVRLMLLLICHALYALNFAQRTSASRVSWDGRHCTSRRCYHNVDNG